MTSYYPDASFRRFVFMRGRLIVAEVATDDPKAAEGDYELFQQHQAQLLAAGDDLIHLEEPGVKGFVYGEPPDLTATIRGRNHGVEDHAKEALLTWARETETTIAFDETFAPEVSSQGDV